MILCFVILTKPDNFLCKLYCACATACPNIGKGNMDAQFAALAFNQIQFRLTILHKAVNRNNARQPVNILDIRNMA